MSATATDVTGVDTMTAAATAVGPTTVALAARPADAGSVAAAGSSQAAFDHTARWQRSSKVGLRPEPFGALAYHFDTRRLVFLKSPKLVELVEALVDHDSASEAIEAVIAPADDRSRRSHLKALASLAEAGVIVPAASPIAFAG